MGNNHSLVISSGKCHNLPCQPVSGVIVSSLHEQQEAVLEEAWRQVQIFTVVLLALKSMNQ